MSRKDVQAKYEREFDAEKKQPTAWSVGGGVKSCLAFSSEIFKRDEVEIVAAAKKMGFRKVQRPSIVAFQCHLSDGEQA